jgi:hypothetical protein
VFAILTEHGLGSFYSCEIAPGLPQRRARTLPADWYAILDQADVA